MLYRTSPHYSSFPFQSYPILSSATTPTSPPPPPPHLHHPLFTSKVGTEMECVAAAALKNSFWRESFGARGSPQVLAVEEFLAGNASGGVPSDDFSVDELLDLSNEDGFVEEEGEGQLVVQEEEEEEEEGRREEHSTEREQSNDRKASVSGFCEADNFPAVSACALSLPAVDEADLEWLSQFVEESFSEHSTAFPAGMLLEEPRSHSSGGSLAPSERTCFKTPVPAKARSKRARTGGRVWSLSSTPSLSESPAPSSSSSATSCSQEGPWLVVTDYYGLVEPAYGKTPPPAKKQKRKPKSSAAAEGPGSGQQPRRCSHCGVQKTPQWRAGPMGAKTLCNACGVRFKSGRLLPEYRPACSPTFSSELHSNHHRKVLEMRRKKEAVAGEPQSLLAVPSF
ncbi:hypothetical protein SAY87_016508 [Trapa incisa]|uniref:GATA-type domain-containing protein n=1 Tax=Trapa incisa TaxID=236973 RepID=A0AAN7L658_9MYRT|nr:hypothetical protein SAY87_016508 [Trapa incisa]